MKDSSALQACFMPTLKHSVQMVLWHQGTFSPAEAIRFCIDLDLGRRRIHLHPQRAGGRVDIWLPAAWWSGCRRLRHWRRSCRGCSCLLRRHRRRRRSRRLRTAFRHGWCRLAGAVARRCADMAGLMVQPLRGCLWLAALRTRLGLSRRRRFHCGVCLSGAAQGRTCRCRVRNAPLRCRLLPWRRGSRRSEFVWW